MEKIILEDIRNLIDEKMTSQEFSLKHWESFRSVYRSVMKGEGDDGDLYLIVYNTSEKLRKNDITPYFRYVSEIYAYFKMIIRNHRLNIIEKGRSVSKEFKNYFINKDMFETFSYDNETNSEDGSTYLDVLENDNNEFDLLLSKDDVDKFIKELEGVMSDNLIKVLVLITKNYNTSEICKILGIDEPAYYNRVWQIKEFFKDNYNRKLLDFLR